MAQIPLDADLDIVAQSNISVTIDPLTKDLNIIQKLDDEPNDVGGMSAQELKETFDKAGNLIKSYINDSLVPQCLSEGVVEKTRVANEEQRKANETARVSAESSRVSAESSRVSAESARVSAESARVNAEKARASAESSRVSVESARQNAETVRASAESGRVTEESVRVENEIARGIAESERGRAEINRELAETERDFHEHERASAESERVQAEEDRDRAESQRTADFDAAQSQRTDEFRHDQSARDTIFAEKMSGFQTAFNAAESERQTDFNAAESARQEAEDARAVWEDYDPAKSYVPGNKVYYLGSSYVCSVPCSGIAPGNSDSWQIIAKKGADGDGAGVSPEQLEEALSVKQDKLLGQKGQFVGFNATGQAVPVPAPEGDLTQESADERYLQKTGGKLEGDISFGFGAGISIGKAKIRFDDYEVGIDKPNGDSYVTGYTPTIILCTYGPFNGRLRLFKESDSIRIRGSNSKADYEKSIPLDGVAPPLSEFCAANKGYVDDYIKRALVAVSMNYWTERTLPASANWMSVAYAPSINGTFVAVASDSDKVAQSEDSGNTWTARALPSSDYWNSVAYGDGVFVAISGSSGKAAYSTDRGRTWAAATLPSTGYNSVTFGNGVFVAIGGTSNSSVVAYSTDKGKTWTAGTLPVVGQFKNIAFGNTAFVSVAEISGKAVYSTDNGKTWSSSALPSSSKWWSSIAFGNGTFVTLSQDGGENNAAYSVDNGETWTVTTIRYSGSKFWRSVIFGNGVFVAVSGGMYVAYSIDNGRTWNSNTALPLSECKCVAFGNDVFVAIASGSDKIAHCLQIIPPT